METAAYVKVNDILFTCAGMAGDTSFKVLPRGAYISFISDAFQQLNMDSFFVRAHKDYDFPSDNLSINLPDNCFNVKNVWVFSGDRCHTAATFKVHFKRNYYTDGSGYFANDKGVNSIDPYYGSRSLIDINRDKSLIRYNNQSNLNNLLFYGVQNGNLMLSSSCRNAGTKVRIDYNSTGCEVGEAPIIPKYFKTAIEDFVIEAALRFRMANEPSNAKPLAYLQQTYANRLDKDGMNGSWHKAVMKVRNMSSAEREDYAIYMGRSSFVNGR